MNATFFLNIHTERRGERRSGEKRTEKPKQSKAEQSTIQYSRVLKYSSTMQTFLSKPSFENIVSTSSNLFWKRCFDLSKLSKKSPHVKWKERREENRENNMWSERRGKYGFSYFTISYLLCVSKMPCWNWSGNLSRSQQFEMNQNTSNMTCCVVQSSPIYTPRWVCCLEPVHASKLGTKNMFSPTGDTWYRPRRVQLKPRPLLLKTISEL